MLGMYAAPAPRFNSRLREEATTHLRSFLLFSRVSTHASVRRRRPPRGGQAS